MKSVARTTATLFAGVMMLAPGAKASAQAPSAIPASAVTGTTYGITESQAAAAPGSAVLYVCNQNDATVSVIDPATRKIIRTVDLQALGFSANAKPHHIAVEPDGSYWYVSLIGDNRVVKLDSSDRVVGQVEFEMPGMLALHPTEKYLVVGRSMTAVNPPPRIGVIDREKMTIEEIDVLFPRPHAIAIEPASQTIYTASLGVNQIAAVDMNSERVELTNVSGPPHALMQFAVSPDGRTMVVSAELSHRLLILDITDRMKPKPVAEVEVEHQPFDPVFTPDGRYVYLGNKAANAITVVDVPARRVAKVIRGGGIAQPHGAVVSADGRWVFVSNNNLKGTGDHAGHMMVGGSQAVPAQPAGPGTVVVIDATTQSIADVITVGHNASGIALPTRQ